MSSDYVPERRTHLLLLLQRTTYIWRKPKRCAGGMSLPEQKVSICKTMDFWLKVGISAGTCAAVLLMVMTCYFWKKNQK